MNGPPAIYCTTCHVLRAIDDWRAHGDSLAITLEPCGHVAVREAAEEWHPARAFPPLPTPWREARGWRRHARPSASVRRLGARDARRPVGHLA
jgi:hypothetical protein